MNINLHQLKRAAILLCGCVLTLNVSAQDSAGTQYRAAVSRHAVNPTAGLSHMKAAKHRHAKVRKAAADDIITEQPEGTLLDNMVVSQNTIAYNSAIGYYDASTDCNFGTVLEGSDNCLYIKDIAPDAYSGTWIKAEKCENDTVLIHRQHIGTYNYSDGSVGELYVCKMAYDPETDYWASVDGDTDIKLIWKNGELFTPEEMNGERPFYVVGVEEYVKADDTLYFTDAYWNMHFYPQTDTYATLPENATPMDMTLSYVWQDGTPDKIHAQVYFDGNEVYVQTDDRCPGWFKGTIEGDKVTFRNAQYLGRHSLYEAHEYFLTCKRVADPDDSSRTVLQMVDALSLDFDSETKTMTASEGLLLTNGGKQKINSAQRFEKPCFYIVQDLPYTPADPIINNFWDYDEAYKSGEIVFEIQPVSTTKEDLDTYYLYYQVYVDDEVFTFKPTDYKTFESDTVELPYGFEDNEGWILSTIVRIFFQPKKNIGIQSIYKGGSEVNKSNIVMFDVNTREISTITTSVDTILAADAEVEGYYTLDGLRHDKPVKGINIVKMSDNTCRKIWVR